MGDMALARALHTENRWHPLDAITWNVGDKGTEDQALKLARKADILGLQECGDRGDLLERLEADGFCVLRGNQPGAASTPLVFEPETMRLIEPLCIPLLPKQFIGPGAGPSWNKPKYAVGGIFEHRLSGRRIVAVSAHNVATQGSPLRRRAATTFATNLVEALDGRLAVTLALMDTNTVPDGASRGPLRKAGWRSAQEAQEDWLPTHGGWTPDDIEIDDQDDDGLAVRIGEARTYPSRSDHRPFHVPLEVKEKS